MTGQLIDLLKREQASLVVATADGIRTFHGRGVADLYFLLCEARHPLEGAAVADKVVGKGASALMVLGGVKEVTAGVVSTPALQLLQSQGIPVRYGQEVPHIVNRSGTGLCPVEELCSGCATAAECLPRIRQFLEERNVISSS